MPDPDYRCLFCAAPFDGWAVGRDDVFVTVCARCLTFTFALQEWLGERRAWDIGAPAPEALSWMLEDGPREYAKRLAEEGAGAAAVFDVEAMLGLREMGPGESRTDP